MSTVCSVSAVQPVHCTYAKDRRCSNLRPEPHARLTSHRKGYTGQQEVTSPGVSPQARQLVKDGFLVELSEGSRKLRHVFLFTDLLLCAKMKKTSVGYVPPPTPQGLGLPV